jgi:hypothetical protein
MPINFRWSQIKLGLVKKNGALLHLNPAGVIESAPE